MTNEEELRAARRAAGVDRGRYRHYRGGIYKAIGVALHSETLEPLVVYHPQDRPPDLWARPAAMFGDKVTGGDGPEVARFLYLGELYTPPENRIVKLEKFVDWCCREATQQPSLLPVLQEAYRQFPDIKARHMREAGLLVEGSAPST